MIEDLINHIKIYISVSEHLEERLRKISTLKVIDKGEFLHKPNRVCNYTYYINSGLLRVYYKKDEKEVTDSFSAEGEWITSIYSFMKNIPDNCFIVCLQKKVDQLEERVLLV